MKFFTRTNQNISNHNDSEKFGQFRQFLRILTHHHWLMIFDTNNTVMKSEMNTNISIPKRASYELDNGKIRFPFPKIFMIIDVHRDLRIHFLL